MQNGISLSLKARVALEANGFHFNHSLGQNFIFDEALLGEIARLSGAGSGTNVLEIGPGAGLLTAALAGRGANVLALELDRRLEPVLEQTLVGFENVHIVFGDAFGLARGRIERHQTAVADEQYAGRAAFLRGAGDHVILRGVSRHLRFAAGWHIHPIEYVFRSVRAVVPLLVHRQYAAVIGADLIAVYVRDCGGASVQRDEAQPLPQIRAYAQHVAHPTTQQFSICT